jgi:hypothetical protein
VPWGGLLGLNKNNNLWPYIPENTPKIFTYYLGDKESFIDFGSETKGLEYSPLNDNPEFWQLNVNKIDTNNIVLAEK